MTESEKAIIAINAAAREKGMSYGHFVVISTAAELQEIVGRFRGPEKKKRKK
jgi:ribosomal protein L20